MRVNQRSRLFVSFAFFFLILGQISCNHQEKSFKAGRVGLGIHGLDNSGLHYFVSVAPQKSNDQLELSNFFPENQQVGVLDDGAFTYHDWDELVLRDVPQSMKGQKLLTTVRGRGVESHLAGAFRTTAYPSSQTADQVLLTWSSDPSTSMDIQWRTNTTVEAGSLKYRESGSTNGIAVEAEKMVLEDRLLMNDRFIHHFTARLRELKPGTTYQYLIEPQTEWSDNYTFSTAANDDSFSFLWFGDTHFSPKYGEILKLANTAHPDAAFYSIVGDLVSDGLYRNQWDDLLEYSKDVICRKPLMAVPGNHDNRAGLGAKTYRDVFSYPENAPAGVPKEQTYSFTYKNTLFLMIDATSPIEAQTSWIEEQLAGTKATWKIVMFHFPPYNWEEPYVNIQKAWVPLFDKYHVDMVFGGHIHYYMRSKPMNAGKVVSSYKEGTAYIISIAIPSRHQEITNEPYAETLNTDGHLYQYIKPEGGYYSSDITMLMEDGSQIHADPVRLGPIKQIESYSGTLYVLRPGKLILFDGLVVNEDFIDWRVASVKRYTGYNEFRKPLADQNQQRTGRFARSSADHAQRCRWFAC